MANESSSAYSLLGGGDYNSWDTGAYDWGGGTYGLLNGDQSQGGYLLSNQAIERSFTPEAPSLAETSKGALAGQVALTQQGGMNANWQKAATMLDHVGTGLKDTMNKAWGSLSGAASGINKGLVGALGKEQTGKLYSDIVKGAAGGVQSYLAQKAKEKHDKKLKRMEYAQQDKLINEKVARASAVPTLQRMIKKPAVPIRPPNTVATGGA